MKSRKTQGDNKMEDTKSSKLIIEYNRVNDKEKKKFAPCKKRDHNDNRLGILSPSLQSIWTVMEKYRMQVDTIIETLGDIIQCFHEESKTEEDIKKLQKYIDQIRSILNSLHPNLKLFKASSRTFYSLVDLDFERSPEMSIFGIREGYVVVNRKDNQRNDKYNPIKDLLAIIGVDIKIRPLMVNLPKDIDTSNMSDKELLKMLLRHMED